MKLFKLIFLPALLLVVSSTSHASTYSNLIKGAIYFGAITPSEAIHNSTVYENEFNFVLQTKDTKQALDMLNQLEIQNNRQKESLTAVVTAMSIQSPMAGYAVAKIVNYLDKTAATITESKTAILQSDRYKLNALGSSALAELISIRNYAKSR